MCHDYVQYGELYCNTANHQHCAVSFEQWDEF